MKHYQDDDDGYCWVKIKRDLYEEIHMHAVFLRVDTGELIRNMLKKEMEAINKTLKQIAGVE